MGKAYKVAGQAIPEASTDTVLYTVPANSNFVESTLSICNQDISTSAIRYRVAIVPSGQTLAAKHYIVFDKLLGTADSKFLTLGLSLGPGDMVYVRSSSSTTSFSLFGVELA